MLSIILNALSTLNSCKTYLAACGLLGLAIYQLSTGQYQTAIQTMLAATAALGLHTAITTTKTN